MAVEGTSEKEDEEDEKDEKDDKDAEDDGKDDEADEKSDAKDTDKAEEKDDEKEKEDEKKDKQDEKKDAEDEKKEAEEKAKKEAEDKAKFEKMVLEDRLESVKAEILNLKQTKASIDKDTYTDQINLEATEVSGETQTSHLGPMLGSMRKDMWTFASPFFMDHADKELAKLEKEQKDIKKQLLDLEEPA